jgi:hypothetical protein
LNQLERFNLRRYAYVAFYGWKGHLIGRQLKSSAHKRFMAGFDNDGDLLAYGETLPVS